MRESLETLKCRKTEHRDWLKVQDKIQGQGSCHCLPFASRFRCSSSAAATLAIRLRLRPAFSTSALVRFTCRLPSASSQQPREQRTIPTARLPVFAARRFVARLVHHAIALLAALAESFTARLLAITVPERVKAITFGERGVGRKL